MIMESLHGYQHRVSYKIGGHSGDSPELVFVEEGAPPRTEPERLRVLREMYAHCGQCGSGDNTIASAERAIKKLAKLEADEHFVFLLSDANLELYGIGPRDLNRLLKLNPHVRVFVIFIGNMGQQVDRLMESLPASQVFTAFETSAIPKILKKCLTERV